MFLFFDLEPGIYHGYGLHAAEPFLWGATYQKPQRAVVDQWGLQLWTMTGAAVPDTLATFRLIKTGGIAVRRGSK